MLFHPVRKKIASRKTGRFSPELADLPPLLQRIYAARDVNNTAELGRSLSLLPQPDRLGGMTAMVNVLAEAIREDHSLLVIGDYDADGATATALAILGLKAMGLRRVSYLVPNRFEYGYGLTPEIVALAAPRKPDILLTVDNGISSHEGVSAARALGMRVLITDHHLPGTTVPDADAIVNPNVPGDTFPSRSLAGVGVMFFVLMALRQHLRMEGWFTETQTAEPNLARFLDLVALGTVADVVPLDHVNRILIHQGLQRIRQQQARPGIRAILGVAGRQPETLVAADLGFSVGPRLNAAGRLEDMSLGIECLLTEHPETAKQLAAQLNELNLARRELEDGMKHQALAIVENLDVSVTDRKALCLFQEDWHQGLIGLVASRIKDRIHRPVIAFALNDAVPGELKGSARSIPGVHIRDVLADIAVRHPELIQRFGGHAMAAGLSLSRNQLADFILAFEAEIDRHMADMDLEQTIQSDGPLSGADLSLDTAELLQGAGPWGQCFPEPLFDGHFEITNSRIVGERHLKLVLKPADGGQMIDGIAFAVDNPTAWLRCRTIHAAYRLDVNLYRNQRSLQLRIEYMEATA